MYLLDTNIISAIARDPKGPAATRLRAVPPERVVTSVLVACEILFGLAKNPTSRTAERGASFLRTIATLPLESDVAPCYAKWRAWLVGEGLDMCANDLLIAAHALAVGATMVTDDRAFARIPDLTVENWLQA